MLYSLIGLLLGRLRLPIQVAIDRYDKIAEVVFSEKKLFGEGMFGATKLENAVKSVLRDSGHDSEESMLDPGGNYEVCQTFVAIPLCDQKLIIA